MSLVIESGMGCNEPVGDSPPNSCTEKYDDDDIVKPSFTIKSFYGGRPKPATPGTKVPFYLRYSLGGSPGDLRPTLLKDVINIPVNSLSNTTTNSSGAMPQGGSPELARPVQRRRPCYYIEASKKPRIVPSPKGFPTFVDSNKVKKDIENIGAVMPQTPSPISYTSRTAVSTGERKFFKNRTPSSRLGDGKGDATVTSATVIKRGFNLSFVPRRLSSSFDKKVKERKRKRVSRKRKGASESGGAEVEEPQLPPLSRVFPELEMETVSTLTSLSVEGGTHPSQAAQGQPPSATKDVYMYSNSESGSNTPLSMTSSDSNHSDIPPPDESDHPRLFPIFSHNKRQLPQIGCLRPPSESNLLMPKFIKDSGDLQQMTLDAGQKKFGAIQCPQCCMVYTVADPLDETTHAKFHHSVLTTLKFPGWKRERVVQEYPDTGSRIILVLPDDPKYAIRKVKDVNKVMGEELGFPDADLSFQQSYKIFLYISEEKHIDGCCVAEAISEGYRVVPNSPPHLQNGRRPFCCHTEPEPSAIGISKIWVYGPRRRNGVASKLLDCVRHWFQYGLPVERNKLAFSDPTHDGMLLASRYSGTPAFLVYKCRT